MTRLRALVCWAADWRNGVTFIGSLLVVLLGVSVVHNVESARRSQRNAHDAIAAAKQASAASQSIADNARRRVDLLTGQIGNLEDQAHDNGIRIGELLADVAALSGQVRQLGGRPVVVEHPASTAPTTRPASPSPPPPSTTTTMSPAPTTTTTACLVRPVIGCLGKP